MILFFQILFVKYKSRSNRKTLCDKYFETGLLCNPHNPIDIAGKISWFFLNQEKKQAIEKNARVFVLRKYGLETIANQNRIFFESFIDE